jgi:WD40 repeat protein
LDYSFGKDLGNVPEIGEIQNLILSSDAKRVFIQVAYKSSYLRWGDFSNNQANSNSTGDIESNTSDFYSKSNQLAVGGADGYIRLYSTNTSMEKATTQWIAHQGKVRNIRFSSDGKQLITTGEDGTIRLWNIQEQQLSLISPLPIKRTVKSISVSPDGDQIALIDSEGNANLWNLSERPRKTLEFPSALTPTSIGFRPDGKLLAVAKKDNSIRVLNLSDNPIKNFLFSNLPVFNIAFLIVMRYSSNNEQTSYEYLTELP